MAITITQQAMKNNLAVI